MTRITSSNRLPLHCFTPSASFASLTRSIAARLIHPVASPKMPIKPAQMRHIHLDRLPCGRFLQPANNASFTFDASLTELRDTPRFRL